MSEASGEEDGEFSEETEEAFWQLQAHIKFSKS